LPYKDLEKAREYRLKHREQRNIKSRELYAKSAARRAYLKAYLQKWRKTHRQTNIKNLSKSSPIPRGPQIQEQPQKEISIPSPKPIEFINPEGLPGVIAWNPKPLAIQESQQTQGPTWLRCENVTHEENKTCGLDPMKRRCWEIPWWTCQNLQKEKEH